MEHTYPQTILISGASSGIGRALALEYAHKGKTLLLLGRHAKRLKEISELCIQKGAKVHTATIDVGKAADLIVWIQEKDRQTPIDLVIANAGISSGGREQAPELAEELFKTNVLGVYNTVFPLIQRMRQRGQGQIAVMSSLAAFRGFPTREIYGASKVAVKFFGEAWRAELQPFGVSVSIIAPGFVETPLTDLNTFKMPFKLTAPAAARIIVQGLRNNKPLIAFPFIPALFARILGLLPPALSDALVRRGLRHQKIT